MGACFDGRAYRTENKDEIRKKFAQAVRDSQHKDGHSYSGAIGMLGETIAKWHDLKLANINDAYEWLEDHHDKWQPAEAVSYQYEAVDGMKVGWLVGGLCSS